MAAPWEVDYKMSMFSLPPQQFSFSDNYSLLLFFPSSVSVVLSTIFAPCTLAQQKATAEGVPCSPVTGILFSLTAFISILTPIYWHCTAGVRKTVRAKYSLGAADENDCLCSLLCPIASLQQAITLSKKGIHPAFWLDDAK